MFLVDTSVWVSLLRGKQTAKTQILKACIEQKQRYGITAQIYQEILQGAGTPEGFFTLQRDFASLPLYHPHDVFNSYADAALIYARLRWRGITVRSTTDCLIAQIALEHGLTLLHDDADFVKIARIEPSLRLA